jgi:hypothetical protein
MSQIFKINFNLIITSNQSEQIILKVETQQNPKYLLRHHL